MVYEAGPLRWEAVVSERRGEWQRTDVPIPDSVRTSGSVWSSASGPSVAVYERDRGVDLHLRDDIRGTWGPARHVDILAAGEWLIALQVAETQGVLALATTISNAFAARVEIRTSDDGGITWNDPRLLAARSALGTPTLQDLDTDGGRWHVTFRRWFGPYRVDIYWLAGAGDAWTEPRRVNTERGTVIERGVASLSVCDDEAFVTWLRASPEHVNAPRFRSTDFRSVPGLDPSMRVHAEAVPNPMLSDGGRLTLDLLEPASVVVELYAVSGRLELRRNLGHLDSGRHTMWWNGKSDHRRALRAGVYFWKIEGTHGSSTTKTTAKLVVRN